MVSIIAATGVRTLNFSVASAVDGNPVSEPLAVTFLKIKSVGETSILSSPTPKAMRVPPGFIPARAGAAALEIGAVLTMSVRHRVPSGPRPDRRPCCRYNDGRRAAWRVRPYRHPDRSPLPRSPCSAHIGRRDDQGRRCRRLRPDRLPWLVHCATLRTWSAPRTGGERPPRNRAHPARSPGRSALVALDADERADIDEVVGMLTGNLDKIAEHGKRADGIVKSMLEHSRGTSGERRSVDLNGLIEEALNLADHGARAQ